MDDKNAKLLNGMLIYAVGNFGTKIMSFLIVPLYTYYISTQDMGTYDLINSTMSMCFPILTLQISDAAYRWLIRGGGDEYKKAAYQIIICNSIILIIIAGIVNLFYSIPFFTYIICSMFTNAVLDTMQKILRGIDNQKLFAISGVFYTFIFLLLNVIQICILRKGIVCLFTSMIIANICVIIFIILKEKKIRVNIFIWPDKCIISKMLKFSVPLVPNQLNWWVMSSSDRYLISFFLGVASNGIYSIAYKFPSLLQVIISLFNTSWQDISISETEKNSTYYTILFRKLYKFSFSLVYFLIPLTQIYIILALNSDYKQAAKYISFLYLGTIFQGFSSFYGVGYLKEKNTKYASLTSIYGAVVNFVVNILMIKFIGLHAAAFSTFMGFLAMWLVREKQNRNSLQILINQKEFLAYLCIGIICAFVSLRSNLFIDCIWAVIGFTSFLFINKDFILWLLKNRK